MHLLNGIHLLKEGLHCLSLHVSDSYSTCHSARQTQTHQTRPFPYCDDLFYAELEIDAALSQVRRSDARHDAQVQALQRIAICKSRNFGGHSEGLNVPRLARHGRKTDLGYRLGHMLAEDVFDLFKQ
jgi:hypothetical protein